MNGDTQRAADQVRGPAIGLVVTAAVHGILWVSGLLWSFGAMAFMPAHGRMYGGSQMMSEAAAQAVNAIWSVIGIAIAALLGYAGMQMMNLRAYNLCFVGAILAMVPCIFPCCFLGLPFGIWALVVLSRPEVKQAFGAAPIA